MQQETENPIRTKLDKLARFVQLQSPDVMKHVRWTFDPKRGTFKAITNVPLTKDESGKLRIVTGQDGPIRQFGAYEPGVFINSYTTPTEAVRFSETDEPGRTAVGNALSSHFAPVAQRQLESVDAYGANPNSGVSAAGDIAQDAIRDVGRYAAPFLVRHGIPNLNRNKKGRALTAGKKGILAGGIAGLASGLHTGISNWRDEDYNAQDVKDALEQGAITAAAVGIGDFVDPFQTRKARIADAMRNSMGMSLNTKIPSRDVELLIDAMERGGEQIPTKAKYWQRPYLDFTKKYGEESGHIERLPAIVSEAKGRPLSRLGTDGILYTERDIMNHYKLRGYSDEQILQMKKSGRIARMTKFINEHYFDPEDQITNDLFGTSKHASLDTRKAAQAPIKLYPKDKAAAQNSFVARAHNWSVLDDDPIKRELGETLREQYHLDNPILDLDYRKALDEANKRRETMGETSRRSKVQILTPGGYEKVAAKKPLIRKGITGAVDALIGAATNWPVMNDLINYWNKDDAK